MTSTAERETVRRHLLAELADLRESGLTVPCQSGTVHRQATWTSDDVDDQALAARLCLACPAIRSCTAYVTTWPREAGVYAGLTEADRKAKRGRPPKNTTTKETAA